MVGKKTTLTDFDHGQIIAKRSAGMKVKDVADAYGISTATIKRICAKFRRNGNCNRKIGSGSRRKTSERDDIMIIRAVKKNRDITAGEIRDELHLENVCEKTIRNRISECSEFKSYWKIQKPFVSEKNRLIRVKWAKEHLPWTVEDWRQVMWSDESPFVLRFAKRQRVWRTFNERYEPWATRATVKHDKRINIWGSFAAHGVGKLYRVIGRFYNAYFTVNFITLLFQ